MECSYSSVDVGQLLGINAFDLDKLLAMDPEFLVRGAGRVAAAHRTPHTAHAQQHDAASHVLAMGWGGGIGRGRGEDKAPG